jgi:transcriptional regulator with XRE-family HTH domain
MPITGPDLRVERRAADITVTDVAARMGLSRQSVHTLERSAVLTVERVQQYRAALADAIVASKEKVA